MSSLRPPRSRGRIAAILGAAAAVALLASACAPKSDSSTSTASGSAAASCSTSSLALYKSGQLTVATDSPAYSPWFDNNNPSDGKGFESAVAYAVAKELGFSASQVKWVTESFDNSYAPGSKNFDFDANEISITPTRAKAVDFSTGYYDVTQGVLTLSNSKYAGAAALSALKGAKIGVQVSTTSYQAVINEIKPSGSVSVYNTTDDEVNALKNGQVDAIVTDMPTVFYLASAELTNGKIVGQFSYDGGSPEQFGLLLQKGSKLTSCVDQALAKLKSNGELASITKQWLSDAADAPELTQ
ncbi:ABC transporter substrate-binding protein [Actinospica sp.]|uniref:ABC transporter substrate-binding protein n=1 Tax=Actinospica sp. TaxID=1872142 RepID=UPI002C225446|nr:ABC transporter substrate-binding protein [Actinospica sp.]HWG28533.1 ABC transporter substrate-binding protein [Actinospica sp.]